MSTRIGFRQIIAAQRTYREQLLGTKLQQLDLDKISDREGRDTLITLRENLLNCIRRKAMMRAHWPAMMDTEGQNLAMMAHLNEAQMVVDLLRVDIQPHQRKFLEDFADVVKNLVSLARAMT